MQDRPDGDAMGSIIDNVQNPPLAHESGRAHAVQRLVKFLADPVRVHGQRTRDELGRANGDIQRKLLARCRRAVRVRETS